jgi:hypothetical protein
MPLSLAGNAGYNSICPAMLFQGSVIELLDIRNLNTHPSRTYKLQTTGRRLQHLVGISYAKALSDLEVLHPFLISLKPPLSVSSLSRLTCRRLAQLLQGKTIEITQTNSTASVNGIAMAQYNLNPSFATRVPVSQLKTGMAKRA